MQIYGNFGGICSSTCMGWVGNIVSPEKAVVVGSSLFLLQFLGRSWPNQTPKHSKKLGGWLA